MRPRWLTSPHRSLSVSSCWQASLRARRRERPTEVLKASAHPMTSGTTGMQAKNRALIRALRRWASGSSRRARFRGEVFPVGDDSGRVFAVVGLPGDLRGARPRARAGRWLQSRSGVLIREAQRANVARGPAPVMPVGSDRASSSLAHDLRTPLNAMVGWLHILEASGGSAEQRARALEGLRRSVAQQRRIVDGIGQAGSPMTKIEIARSDQTDHSQHIPVDEPRQSSGHASGDATNGEPAPQIALNGAGSPALDAEPGLDGIWVLAIDEQATTRDALAAQLARWGARAKVLTSAEAASKAYVDWASGPGERVFLCSCDATSSQEAMDLIGSLRQIEAEHHLPRVPAIALSASSHTAARRAALRAGFDELVAMPLGPSELRRVLAKLTGRSLSR